MANQVNLYRDGYDLYLTSQQLDECEYEECVSTVDNMSDAISNARDLVEEQRTRYIWIDKAQLTSDLDADDIGVFAVDNGAVYECNKGGASC